MGNVFPIARLLAYEQGVVLFGGIRRCCADAMPRSCWRIGNYLPPFRCYATSGNAEFSCVGARDRRGHGPMYGPGCAVSDINTGAGVAAPSRRARTRVYVRARAALCAGF